MIELLHKTLIFNPKDRIKAADALNEPCFAEIRRPKAEREAKGAMTVQIDELKTDANGEVEMPSAK